MRAGARHPGSPFRPRFRISVLPTTTLGRWAVGLAGAFFPLVFAAPLVPRAAAVGLVCGLASGLVALTAIVRDRERGVTVFAALVPVAVAIAFVLAEVIGGNP
jgi:hypothetical protein